MSLHLLSNHLTAVRGHLSRVSWSKALDNALTSRYCSVIAIWLSFFERSSDQIGRRNIPFVLIARLSSKLFVFYFTSAIDAYCLLEVYEVLKVWVTESRLRVNMEPPLVLSWLQPKKEKQRYSW